ncbi:MAG: hypothetical protein G3M70_10295 [Candidatus Nitronauta litoralis]|uniref:Uncharacterized protein n=1 Tax=Candidatus Nitronauta litoralis TaxID=2705533 RepID=A0A7T0G0S8_9BACT|nr:MAG: hypothetical protein G3M70_10295 [Candidatus Nitronauta litoralis]
MKTFLRLQYLSLLALCLSLSACAENSVVFHERTQFGLNLEARPELSTPVNLNMAYNRNLLAVVPSKNEGDESTENSAGSRSSNNDQNDDSEEAVSILSTFGVNYKKNEGFFSGSNVFIHNHFATGKAAKALTKPASGNGGTESNVNDRVGSSVESTNGNSSSENIMNVLTGGPN